VALTGKSLGTPALDGLQSVCTGGSEVTGWGVEGKILKEGRGQVV